MSKPIQRFKSREEVEKWIDESLANGMSTQLIFALIQKKAEELSEKKHDFLLKRRDALVNGNTTVATELHALMKECEEELRYFAEVCGSIEITNPAAKEKIMDAQIKSELLENLPERLN